MRLAFLRGKLCLTGQEIARDILYYRVIWGLET